ncbi:PTS sugar transporter subunit IIA [Staphylococcus hominis]|uniref:PTS sugar transporter subunit IIA n=1 Tax=Staphylococcus hominis TaxID=1290 RepID=UPI0023AF9005|nr:PTS sugar transporter subunit IIA [Staphylococcus hominis]
MKVVLLCGSGIGTSQLLKNKLINLYPEFEIVDAYSVYQINEKELKGNGIDYIISTVPVNVENLSVIQVDPFLNKSSRIKLNNVINFSREKRFNQNYKNSYELKDLLPAHRINKVTKIMNKDEAIDISVQSLIEDGIVSPKYSCEIKKQLDIFGPYMVISPHIALIHASNKYVIEGAGFAITFFKNGIIFNHELNDPVYLVITIATINPYYHLNGLIQLSELLTDSENREIFLKGNINRIKNLVANSIKKEV